MLRSNRRFGTKLASLGVVACLAGGVTLAFSPPVLAQPHPQPKPTSSASAKPNDRPPAGKGKTVDVDAESPAGQPTEEAAQARRLFDAGKWSQAALALKKVTGGETGDDEGNKQIAHSISPSRSTT